MNLTVFGANGPTGRHSTEQALAAGHTVTAVTRRPAGFPIDGPRLRVVGADVHDPEAVDAAVAGQDAVVSALGVPYSRHPVAVYSAGAASITRAMTRHGVKRLVCVTSTVLFDTAAPGENLFFRGVVEPLIARTLGRTVYQDMRRMEQLLAGTGLEWTVLRPGGLFDTAAVSDYRTGPARLPGRYTARPDLAHALLAQAESPVREHRFLDVRTTAGTPTLLQLMRKEAAPGS